MRILVTGGTGFVGTKFFELLTARGHEVVRFDLHPPADGSEYVHGDVRDRDALDAAMTDVDAVIHLAAAHHDFGITTKTFHDVNVGGMQNVCDLMTKHGCKKLCFFSTVAIYGSQPYPNEDTTPAPESDYGKTKLGAEKVCRSWADKDDNQCLTIRPTVIFGKNHFANMFFLIQQIDGGRFLPVGKMDNIKSLAFIDNIVATVLDLWFDQAGKRKGFECFNYVDTPDLTSREISNAAYAGLGKPLPKFVVPYPIARLLVVPFDILIALTGKNLPVSSARIKKLAKVQTQFNAEKIHAVSGHTRQPLADGIQEMAKWYIEVGKKAPQLNRRPPETV